MFTISVQAPPKRFSASITARSHGALRFAICESTAYDIDRTQKDISNESADHYLMDLQLRGHTLLTQANDAIEFGRNDIVIADGRRPYHAAGGSPLPLSQSADARSVACHRASSRLRISGRVNRIPVNRERLIGDNRPKALVCGRAANAGPARAASPA